MNKSKSFLTLSLPLILGLGLAIILPTLAQAQKVRTSEQFTAISGASPVATGHRSLITAPDAPSNGNTCFATIDGTTVYSSTDASPVQDAVDAASDDDLVKVAGYCAGVQGRAGVTQTVYISQPLTIQGGYTHTNWIAAPDPVNYPTTLDAQGSGRVVYIPTDGSVTLSYLTLTSGNTTGAGDCDDPFTPGPNGGGICVDGIAAVTVTHSIITGNIVSTTAGLPGYLGGGIYKLSGVMNIINTTVTSNTGKDGGGLFNRYSPVNVINSTFSDNYASANGGGILMSHGTFTITNSTISGNTSNGNGGGIFIWTEPPRGLIIASTVVSNTTVGKGGGIIRWNKVPLTISNTIVANNKDTGGDAPDCSGTITSGDYNLVEDTTGCTFTPLTNDITGSDPKLGLLVDNGGDTETHALLTGSSAIDKIPYGTNGCGITIVTDQRGITRPKGSSCDMGAYEYVPVCFVEANSDNTTDYSSTDASAIQAAVDAASDDNLIKVAGSCGGVQGRAGVTQTVYISKTLTLRGGYTTTNWITSDPDTNPTILDAQGGGRVVYIPSGYTVTLTSLTLTGGDSSQGGVVDYGGGLYNTGSTVTISNSQILTNTAGSRGGGIYNTSGSSVLTLTNSLLRGNSSGGFGGGGLHNRSSGSATVDNSTIISNTATTGGGIYNSSSNGLTVMNSSIISNTATGSAGGGGLYQEDSTSWMTVISSTIRGNQATGSPGTGGGIVNVLGQLDMINSNVANNEAKKGGGLYNQGFPAVATLVNSTFSNNRANGVGGGIHNQSGASVKATNSTFSGNEALVTNGGALNNIFQAGTNSTMILTNTTIVSNTATGNGGGVNNTGDITLTNSLIAYSSGSGGDCYNNGGTVGDNGYNLIEDSGNACGLTDGSNNNIVGSDPLLGPLADNGGPTWTHALQFDSPALDRIPYAINGCGTTIDTDQRSIFRPQMSRCDIGAYESEAYQLTVTKSGTGGGLVTSTPAGIDCGDTCSVTFHEGTVVTLIASADIGSAFFGWSGAGCSGTDDCVVTMDAAKSVTATFTLDTHELTVSRAGTGSGSVSSTPAGIDCGADCSETYDYGTVVTLTASADTGSTFTGWSGDCSGTAVCEVTMDAAKSVTATFTTTVYDVFLPIIMK